ncbi:hypothetical protein L9F63_022202, partial [Diploptera punctata]
QAETKLREHTSIDIQTNCASTCCTDNACYKIFFRVWNVYPFPSIPSCNIPLALKQSVAAHWSRNKICFNKGESECSNIV